MFIINETGKSIEQDNKESSRQSTAILTFHTDFEPFFATVYTYSYSYTCAAGVILLLTLPNQYDIHDDIKSRLNSGNACYRSVQNLLSSCLISKNLKIKIYRTVILPVVVLYGCETWSLTLGKEHRLRVSENSVLRRIFGPKREEDGSWRKLHNDELHILYFSPNIVRMIKSRR
jgi:hypothetical protein